MALTPNGTSTTPSGQGGTVADVVAVLRGDTFAQVFARARPMTAIVRPRADLMEHPLEDGSSVVDHRVQRPTEIDLPVTIEGAENVTEVYAEIRLLWETGAVLTVQTRAHTYTNMVIRDMPHDERADEFDNITIGLSLLEAKFVKAIYGGLAPKQVKSKPKASTVKRGAQQTTPATGPQQAKAAVAYDIFHAFPDIFHAFPLFKR